MRQEYKCGDVFSTMMVDSRHDEYDVVTQPCRTWFILEAIYLRKTKPFWPSITFWIPGISMTRIRGSWVFFCLRIPVQLIEGVTLSFEHCHSGIDRADQPELTLKPTPTRDSGSSRCAQSAALWQQTADSSCSRDFVFHYLSCTQFIARQIIPFQVKNQI